MIEPASHVDICRKIAELKRLPWHERSGMIWIQPSNDGDYPFDPVNDDALCFQLMIEFCVTFYPKRKDETLYRYGSKTSGPYARCGSHEPVYHENPNIAVCLAITKTYCRQETLKS